MIEETYDLEEKCVICGAKKVHKIPKGITVREYIKHNEKKMGCGRIKHSKLEEAQIRKRVKSIIKSWREHKCHNIHEVKL